MPSAPPLTATPNCFVLKRSAASEFASRAMHLAIRRRMTSPTAIGRTPPFNFFNAVIVALHSIGATNSGSWPLLAKLTNFVKLVIARFDWSGAPQFTACSRCSGYIFDGPAAVNLENDSIWKNTDASSNWYAFVLASWSNWWSGCFSLGWSFLSSFNVAALSGATPSEDRTFAALPNCPCRQRFRAAC